MKRRPHKRKRFSERDITKHRSLVNTEPAECELSTAVLCTKQERSREENASVRWSYAFICIYMLPLGGCMRSQAFVCIH